MQATLTSLTNPIWANEAHTMIDCEITTSQFGDELLPFTASQNDVEPHGRAIFSDIVAGAYGPVGAYVPPPPPPPPSAEQNKAKAVQLLSETDWVNQPDVVDPNVNPHLLNHADFITYRAALRTIAVNPQPGVLVWPTKPQEQWS